MTESFRNGICPCQRIGFILYDLKISLNFKENFAILQRIKKEGKNEFYIDHFTYTILLLNELPTN